MKYLIIATALLIVITSCAEQPRLYDDFAQCLTEKGAVMYGTEWCSHCKIQKAWFGKSFEYVNYVDCDYNGEECLKNGVQGYPTWKINNKLYSGKQPLEKLSSLTGCELNVTEVL